MVFSLYNDIQYFIPQEDVEGNHLSADEINSLQNEFTENTRFFLNRLALLTKRVIAEDEAEDLYARLVKYYHSSNKYHQKIIHRQIEILEKLHCNYDPKQALKEYQQLENTLQREDKSLKIAGFYSGSFIFGLACGCLIISGFVVLGLMLGGVVTMPIMAFSFLALIWLALLKFTSMVSSDLSHWGEVHQTQKKQEIYCRARLFDCAKEFATKTCALELEQEQGCNI